MRALFWGMNGVYTWTVLEMLLDAGISVAAVLVHGAVTPTSEEPPAFEPLTAPPTGQDELGLLPVSDAYLMKNTVNIAWQYDLPVYAVHELTAKETADLVQSFDADVACVACYPRRLPQTLLNLPAHGFLNVHPSRLPDYRGPAPLFWQLRDGVNPVGVTVHWMDARLDSGDIAAQASVRLPDGIDGPAADKRLGKAGGQLLADTLASLQDGRIVRQPQPAGGSHQPWPKAEDFGLSRSWPARRAYNFMRGTAEWGMPYALMLDSGEALLFERALSFSAKDRLEEPLVAADGRASIQFTPGVLVAALAQPDNR